MDSEKEGFLDETKSIFDFELQGEIVDQDKPKYSVMSIQRLKRQLKKLNLISGYGNNSCRNYNNSLCYSDTFSVKMDNGN